MKKLITGSLIMAVMLLVGSFSAPAQAQSPASDVKPTFLAPTPGLFVNGWPAFTVSSPKDWVEQPLLPGQVFRVAAPKLSLPPSLILVINAFANSADITNSANAYARLLGQFSKDIKVLYDKPSQLKDGTPAQEAEIDASSLLHSELRFYEALKITNRN